jgi:hypothetical protein
MWSNKRYTTLDPRFCTIRHVQSPAALQQNAACPTLVARYDSGSVKHLSDQQAEVCILQQPVALLSL